MFDKTECLTLISVDYFVISFGCYPGVGHNTPSGLKNGLNGMHGGDIGKAKNILKDSPKATFRILNNGKYYDYTNKVRQ